MKRYLFICNQITNYCCVKNTVSKVKNFHAHLDLTKVIPIIENVLLQTVLKQSDILTAIFNTAYRG